MLATSIGVSTGKFVFVCFEVIFDCIPDEITKFNKINRNAFKPPVSEEVKDIVRANFTKEIEFYQFCRQRLHQQLVALKLN